MADDPRKFDADAASALFALAATENPPAGACPTVEEIAAWHAKALVGNDAGRVDAHVPHCQRCLTLWAGLLAATGQLEPSNSGQPGFWLSVTRFWQRPGLVAAAVIAIGLAGVVLQQQQFGGDTLAAYTLQIDDRMQQRGEVLKGGDTTATFGPGDRFELTVRPETAVDGPVEIAVFADSGLGAVPLALPAARIAPGGVLQIAGTVDNDVQLPAGMSTMYVLVGRAGKLPDVQRAMAKLGGDPKVSERDWSAWSLTLDVRGTALP